MRLEKSFKYYSNDQRLLYREQTWFKMTDKLHALMLNQNIIDERILITLRNWSLKG
jgi:fumarate reductase subunit C